MYEEFTDEVTPPRSRFRRFIYALVVLLLIIGLLGSSAVAFWFFTRQAQEPAEPTRTLPTATLPVAATRAVEEVATPTVAAVGAGDAIGDAIGDTSEDASNRIAYIAPGGQVATISPDGSDRRFISSGRARFLFPTWSPDGRYLAAIGSRGTSVGVYLLTDESGGPNTRTMFVSRVQAPFYLYWSPDGRLVSFLANHPTEGIGLHLAPIDEDEATRLLATGSPFYWDWTASGDEVLIHTGFSGSDSKLAFLSTVIESDPEEVARPGFFQAPGISSSGRYLAYAEETIVGDSQLVVADVESGEVQNERHAGLVALGWSPVDDQLAVISAVEAGRQFHGPLRLIDAATQEVRLLSRDTVLAFFWSPDGRYLAVISTSRRDNDINVKLPEDGGSRQPQLAKSAGRPVVEIETMPLQDEHAFKLVIIEAATGRTSNLAFFLPSPLFVAQLLPFFDQYALSHTLWSPASDAFVLPMQIDGENRIVVIDVESGQTDEIADGDLPFWSPR